YSRRVSRLPAGPRTNRTRLDESAEMAGSDRSAQSDHLVRTQLRIRSDQRSGAQAFTTPLGFIIAAGDPERWRAHSCWNGSTFSSSSFSFWLTGNCDAPGLGNVRNLVRCDLFGQFLTGDNDR